MEAVIYLDNSNGTIKYNTTSNFNYSLTGYYSSPYLLKNAFTNPSINGIFIKASSIPVMKLISSGSTARWLGGNNYITGSSMAAAIFLAYDAYPLIDSGYNNISPGSADYMQGSIPSDLSGNLQATLNNWDGGHTSSTKFNVSSGSVTYSPDYDGSTLPSTNGYELTDIGFGLYDTVYTSGGDNPLADVLYIQAYLAEKQGDYTTAISKYTSMVSNYNTSSYASISLSKIFNCMEKKRSTHGDFQQIGSYYTGIKNNTTYNVQLREIAEDLAIKSKFRQGLTDDAIADYNTMYQQNINTPKGFHALINKECLEAMLSGGDNQSSSYNTSRISKHLHNLYALEYGENIFKQSVISNIPLSYTLYQNYPNPFNPTTTIRYDIPKSGLVSLKIYDILGREIYSVTEFRNAGHYEVKFDASNYASGLYFYRIESGSFVQTKKMVLVK